MTEEKEHKAKEIEHMTTGKRAHVRGERAHDKRKEIT